MAIVAGLFAFGSRFAGQVVTTALSWASTLLFGRVPADRQRPLLGVAFGSIIWVVLIAGVFLPDLGTFLLLALPLQNIIPDWVLRTSMLIGALVVPGVVGLLVMSLDHARRRGRRAAFIAVLRGYPLTVLLAVLLVFLALLAVWRKAASLKRGWSDAHVPFVVKPGGYERVAEDLRLAIVGAGLHVSAGPASLAMSRPAIWLGRVAGSDAVGLVPDRMVRLRGPELDVLIYPMDALISGKPAAVTKARAAIASRLTTSAAHLTVSAEAQAIEDRLAVVATGPRSVERPVALPMYDLAAERAFTEIDASLERIEVSYDEWETLYRQRLQIERDLRARSMKDLAETDEETVGETERSLGHAIRDGATVVVKAATDDRTIAALDHLAGPAWRIGLSISAASASIAARALASIIRRAERRSRTERAPIDDARDDNE